MTRNTKKASSRLFYVAPRKWQIWQWLFTPGALVIFLLSAWLTAALVYLS